MPAVTRISDSTTGTCDIGEPCCPHGRSGTNATGSPDVLINGKAAHRLGDTGPTNCPHGGTFESVKGSTTVKVNGRPLVLVGHTTTCQACAQSGSHSSGSPNVTAE